MSIYIQWKHLQRLAQKVTATDLNVLYKGSGLFAIEKPYGIPVHHGPKVKKSIQDLIPDLEELYKLPKNSLALANRLDKNVSGVLLMTYDKKMAAKIAELYRQRLVRKKYLAVLVGGSKVTMGNMSGSFAEKHTNNQYKQVIVEDSPEIQTSFKILDRNKKTCMLCALETFTGHRHQIRVHLSQLLNCPILGDHKYHPEAPEPQRLPLRLMQMLGMDGVASLNSRRNSEKGIIRPWQRGLVPMHLFAQHIRLPKLIDGDKDLKIAAPIPEYLLQTIEACGLMFDRQEFELKAMNKKRKNYGPMRDSVFVPKGVTPRTTGNVTSL